MSNDDFLTHIVQLCNMLDTINGTSKKQKIELSLKENVFWYVYNTLSKNNNNQTLPKDSFILNIGNVEVVINMSSV